MQIQEDKPYDDINITPMLDLAYVLLVIFILMCTASVQGLKVNLPHASNAPAPPNKDKPKLQAILVDNEGKYKLNTTPITLAELGPKLTQLKAASPDVSVVIRGESQTPYVAVMQALGCVTTSGITQVGLATKSAGK